MSSLSGGQQTSKKVRMKCEIVRIDAAEDPRQSARSGGQTVVTGAAATWGERYITDIFSGPLLFTVCVFLLNVCPSSVLRPPVLPPPSG